MKRPLIVVCLAMVSVSAFAGDRTTVQIEPTKLLGPRPLATQTQDAVVRDYLESWKTLTVALAQNRPDLLSPDFVGTAGEKLAGTVQEQSALGISTRYQDLSHDLKVVFYSPEGLSVQLVDNVEYTEQIYDHDKVQATQRMHARYVVVLTPAEMRWRVRIFQSEPE